MGKKQNEPEDNLPADNSMLRDIEEVSEPVVIKDLAEYPPEPDEVTPPLNPRFMFVDEVPDEEVMKESVADKGDLAKVQDRVMMAYRISRDKAVNSCLEGALEELKKLTGNQ